MKALISALLLTVSFSVFASPKLPLHGPIPAPRPEHVVLPEQGPIPVARPAQPNLVIGDDGQRVLNLLTSYCMPALTEATKDRAFIGTAGAQGDIDSNTFTITFNLFQLSGESESIPAGSIVLQAKPWDTVPADAPSFQATCDFKP